MSITRDKIHKRRNTSGKQKKWRKKRSYEVGRPPAMTHLGGTRVHTVRCHGGIIKHRALRLEQGNFSWGTQVSTRKARIINVVYNASNNEFVRMNTLVKGAIVEIDSAPFAAWYEKRYGVSIGKPKVVKDNKKVDKKTKGKAKAKAATVVLTGKATPAATPDISSAPTKKSRHVLYKIKIRSKKNQLESNLADQFSQGRLYARISSRPGQSGRADGYILEGPELDFYVRKIGKKKSGK